ncbi:MAG: Spx/MgsR family RNA polymerase-binding regulatory protein [Verrucomicrobia bacterium]|nr:MAG: Spx/MgsR family RNA polymerase-binding regulatory protein [Verrucomicrobiota bacterium]
MLESECIIYVLDQCDTCRKAKNWLHQHQIPFRSIAIREHAPSIEELNRALAGKNGKLQDLLNRSGHAYRELEMKNKLKQLSTEQVLELLSQNGNLVKRPLLVHPQATLIGFDPTLWQNRLLSSAT